MINKTRIKQTITNLEIMKNNLNTLNNKELIAINHLIELNRYTQDNQELKKLIGVKLRN
jgi:hypothetical protein